MDPQGQNFTSFGGPEHLQRFGQQMEGVQAADKAAMDQRSAAMMKPMSALSAINGQPMPQPPTPQQAPPAPDAKDFQKDAMAFASAMAVLGAVAGRFARVPGGAALSAFAGALNGWQTGNLQAYEQAAKKWEQDTKATVENNRQVLEKYKLALQDRKMNIDEQMSQIQMISAEFHDKIMYDAAAAKNYTLVAQIYEKNAEYTGKVEESAQKLQQRKAEQDEKAKASATYWMNHPEEFSKLPLPQQATVKQLMEIHKMGFDPSTFMTPGPRSEVPGSTQVAALTPPGTATDAGGAMPVQSQPNDPGLIDKLARQDLQGDHSWRTNYGRGAQSGFFLRAIDARKAQIMQDEGITPEDVAQRNLAYKAKGIGMNAEERTGAGVAANVDLIMRNAHAAIPQALEASEKVSRGNFVPLNKLLQTAEGSISDPALKEFRMANLNLAELWARAMNPRGVMRVADRDRALEILGTADSPETYRRVVSQLNSFLDRERKSVEDFRAHREPAPFSMTAPPKAGNDGWTVKEIK